MEKAGEPKLVNTWKPVTSEWEGTETPAVVIMGTTEVESRLTLAAACKPSARKARTPLLIAVYAGYCFLRSAGLLAGLCILLYAPESDWAKLIYAETVPTVERLIYPDPVVQMMQAPETSFDQEEADLARRRAMRLIPEVFLLLAVPYSVSGVMWLQRSKMARMLTMLTGGFSAASAALNWCLSRFVYSDLVAPFSSHTGGLDLILPGILLNLFVSLYLAYSPAVIEAFRDGED